MLVYYILHNAPASTAEKQLACTCSTEVGIAVGVVIMLLCLAIAVVAITVILCCWIRRRYMDALLMDAYINMCNKL